MHLPGAWPGSDEGSGSRGEKAIVLAVMGVTGSGKSTFIKNVTGHEGVSVSSSLSSDTSEVVAYKFQHRGVWYILIDTPGFNGTVRPDNEITTLILSRLKELFAAGTQLNGVIYLHRIIDPRMSGSALRNTRMFRKLVGSNGFKNVVLATTFWDVVTEKVGAARERELRNEREFWGSMVEQGAQMGRLENNRASGLDLIEKMGTQGELMFSVQEEVFHQGETRAETEVPRDQRSEVEQLRRTLEAQRMREENDLRQALQRQESICQRQIELQRLEMEERLAAEQQAKRERQDEELRQADAEFQRQKAEIHLEMERQERRRREQAVEMQRRIEDVRTRGLEAAVVRQRIQAAYTCIGYKAQWPCDKCHGSITAYPLYYREYSVRTPGTFSSAMSPLRPSESAQVEQFELLFLRP
ncbi:P-loop containing nucleoside triphosphate hydrolase protein [Emericellopsis atlantica]|uniref:P-loop containing nucleoside triphosphate hydrolase protein n=1 Tax=Emericellopsis atlantica TaxID=2614577 RepID=A0A9P8CMF2_9HYPO|nr:P-loop containing nucleoside triphosphate hydrolase protein [Emericellopsis atlantica]KAG9251955.1 P-loop containing nucleoside triphosphate hydrolase protein [Emericellopsis atlantica]